MDECNIIQHPVFRRLSPEAMQTLLDAANLYEASKGATLYHTGDSGEDVIFLLQGRLEAKNKSVYPHIVEWFPGDLVGHDRLVHPRPVEADIKAAEESRWLSWSRDTMLKISSHSSVISRALKPLFNSAGAYLSGLPEELPSERGVTKSRRSRQSLRPLSIAVFLGSALALLLYILSRISPVLNAKAVIVAPVLLFLWFLGFMVKYFSSYYVLEPDAINFRSFSWYHLAVSSRFIPIDTVLGVEANQNKLFNRIIGTGTVIIKTSAIEGNIVLENVNHPQKTSRIIMERRKSMSERSKRLNQETMRRILEKDNSNKPRLLRASKIESSPSGKKRKEFGETCFRKSIFVLIWKLILPAILTILPLLARDFFAAKLPFFLLVPIPAFFWLMYRFENWRNDKFIISGGYAIKIHRVPLGLKETRKQVELAAVQNIRTEQNNFLAVLLGFGNVVLVTSGGGADMFFREASRPWRLQQQLFRRREEIKSLEEGRQRDRENEQIIKMAHVLRELQVQSSEEAALNSN